MRSSNQVERLAPILQASRHSSPDWKAIALQLFVYLDLDGLPIKGKQDWKAISQRLLDHLKTNDSHYQRILILLAELNEQPKDIEQLTELTGLNHNTIRQTLLALTKGGYTIEHETSPNTEGRPRKAFFLKP